MANICKKPNELSNAIKNQEDEIIIEGDLAKKVWRIKITGKVAWGFCAASLAAAITFFITTPASLAAPPAAVMHFISGNVATAAAATTLGTAVVPAVVIGVCAGGIGVLNTLRDKYKIVEKDDKHIKLKRK